MLLTFKRLYQQWVFRDARIIKDKKILIDITDMMNYGNKILKS